MCIRDRSDDIAALDAAGIDRKALAAKGVRVFYTCLLYTSRCV